MFGFWIVSENPRDHKEGEDVSIQTLQASSLDLHRGAAAGVFNGNASDRAEQR